MKRLAVWLILGLILASLSVANAEQTVLVSFVGDCTIGCEEHIYDWDNGFAKTVEREGYAYFFAEVYSLLSLDDVTIANFEGVLKRSSYGESEKTYAFRGLPAYAQILTLGSVEAVGLENNHTEDYGATGKNTTKTALTDAGVAWFDASDAYLYEKDGITVAFLSIWQQWVYNYGSDYEATIAKLRQEGADAIVVYLHSGEEYSTTHSEQQTKTAYRFIDAGADAVVMAHPHVVQGVEVYNDRLILYSLGNFVFGGNVNVRALETMIPQITFTFAEDGTLLSEQLRIYPANVSSDAEVNTFQPCLVTGEAANAVYALIDHDSEGLTLSYTVTDDYRDYEPLILPTVEKD